MKIKRIITYEILASGGFPSIECRVELENGSIGVASVPYGASAGTHEATVLKDNDNARFFGNGMLKAVKNANEIIAPNLIGLSANMQSEIDQILINLDGTSNKSKLGGNAILAVSLAVARAASSANKLELFEHIINTYSLPWPEKLPNPMIVAIEGGKHAYNTTDLQEFCITGISNSSVTENIRKSLEVYHSLKKVLIENNLSVNVGNEGAFAPEGIKSNEDPFNFILKATEMSGYKPEEEIAISVDAAASEYYKNGKYELKVDGKSLTGEEVSAVYEDWFKKYPIVTFEDGHDEDDWESWVELKKICDSHNVKLVGDDLTVTNTKRLTMAIQKNAISSILIKLNQIGTLTETVNCCKLAQENGISTITSHRGGGETNDTAMIDLAVAVGSDFVKVGPTRGERVSKYNRLMEIERLFKL